MRTVGRPVLGSLALGVLLLAAPVRAGPPPVEEARARLDAAEARGDRAEVARSLLDLGRAHRAAGDLRQAIDLLDRALRLREELGDRTGVGETLLALGETRADWGDYAAALDLLERARALATTLGDRPALARALTALGRTRTALGETSRALELLGVALAIQEETGDRGGAARTAAELGRAHLGEGRHAEARVALERALAVFESVGDRAEVARALQGLAEVHAATAEPARAVATLERVLPILESLGRRHEVVRTLVSLGRARLALGEVARAREAIDRALREAEGIGSPALEVLALGARAVAHGRTGEAGEADASARRAVASLEVLLHGLTDEEGASLRAQLAEVLDVGARAAAQTGVPADVWFFLEAARAASLLESLASREGVRAAALPGGLREEETVARRALADAAAVHRLAREAGDRERVRDSREAMARARARLVDVFERIGREVKRTAGVLHPRPSAIEEVRAALGPSEGLVLYGARGASGIALVATRSGTRVVVLGPWERVLEAARAVDPDRAGEDFEARVSALRGLVSTPLEVPDEVRTLLVAPEGELAFVPPVLLFPGRDVAYVPSATTWLLLREDRARHGVGVLAVADPAYPETSFARLPGAREEARAVGDVLLLGEEATVPRLRDALASRPRWSAVHFGCHAFEDPERPLLSALALTPSGTDDGFLRAVDVLRLRVPADLVVLAGSDTGRGRIVPAEGVVGLVRAFVHADAPRVVASLGASDDEATKALMTRFYERWKSGSPTAAALREAQESIRSEEPWRHPRFWAPWVLWGLAD